MRIKKAVEYGASWIRKWQSGVTHIIVDRGIPREDVLRFLKLADLPVSSICIVIKSFFKI